MPKLVAFVRRISVVWTIALATLGVFAALGRRCAAEEKVATCVQVEADEVMRPGLVRLVSSEVDRHPSHRVVTTGCVVHLRVELVVVGRDRFLTGRVGGEVPDRVQVGGPPEGTPEGSSGTALERAVVDLLRVVLGSDPVALKVPGGQSWFAGGLLELRNHARSTVDVSLLETGTFLSGRATFLPGIGLAYAREIAAFQIGIELMAFQDLEPHPGRVDLDTELRLHAVATYFFSSEADVSGFAGLALGLGHQRFSGPRSPAFGGGEGQYDATGPALGLRCGVEFFRTTTTRAFVLLEAFVPAFRSKDDDAELVSAWVPGVSMGAGVRF